MGEGCIKSPSKASGKQAHRGPRPGSLLDSWMAWGTPCYHSGLDSSSVKWESQIRSVFLVCFEGRLEERYLSLHKMYSHTHNFINNIMTP